MNSVFVLSHSKYFADALKRNLEAKYNLIVEHIEIPHIDNDIENDKLIIIFKNICDVLKKYPSNVLRNSFSILDLPFSSNEIKDYNPLKTSANINQLASLLILAFPEIFWILPCYYSTDNENLVCFVKYNNLIEIISENWNIHTNLFDCIGIRKKILEDVKKNNECDYISLNDKGISASIDEEKSYSYFNGYVAYKLGYNNYVVTNLAELEKINNLSTNKPNLIFEDVFLNFPDRHPQNFSNLKERDNKYSFFSSANTRVFVSVWHKGEFEDNNKDYLNNLKLVKNINIKKVNKPAAGIYDLVEKSGFIKDYWKICKGKMRSLKEFGDNKTGHSAPGRLLLIGEILLDRANVIFDEAKNIEDCIHGAVLACEAIRLTGYKTPTFSIEAVGLKHQLELKAECMFYGVAYNINLKNRFKELDEELKKISKWFKLSKRVFLIAYLEILNNLVKILREFNQFDEELECLKLIRKLDRKWYFMNRPYLFLLYPVRAYIETLMNSLPRFIVAILLWPFIGGLVSKLCCAYFGNEISSFSHHIFNSYYTFFGLQPTVSPLNGPAYIITTVLVFLGFFHLGIFVSYLYSLISRK